MQPSVPLRDLLTWLVAVFLLTSAAFGFAQQPAPQQIEREELTIDPTQWRFRQPWKGDLDGMIERRVIRVLTAYSKTQYFMDKGIQRGATYDAFQLLEEALNRKLEQEQKLEKQHIKVRFVFIPVGREQLLPALAAGKGDIAAGNLTVTPERRKLVDFSAPVATQVSEVLVTGPASPAIAKLDDLAGKEVFVRRSSSYHESLVALNKRFAAEKKAAVIIKEAPETLEDEDLLEMLNAGLVSLTVVDKHIADFWKQVFPKIKAHDGVALRTGGEIAWAMRQGSPQLKALLDEFAVAATSGKYASSRAVILARYLKNTKFVKDAASAKERQKFQSLVRYFQKYGDKYDVDWLLMAAQGYQESRLDQKARSHVGALGVMQIMPATGKDLKVGDIRKVEPNIHAGIKYMRWMIDNYYGNEPMTKLDKALFAFASYNAGPGRIRQLRQEAAQQGLDPNVWFRNVEYVVADRIGRETITYVSNIYKYYIAYRLIMESRQRHEAAKEALKGQKQ